MYALCGRDPPSYISDMIRTADFRLTGSRKMSRGTGNNHCSSSWIDKGLQLVSIHGAYGHYESGQLSLCHQGDFITAQDPVGICCRSGWGLVTDHLSILGGCICISKHFCSFSTACWLKWYGGYCFTWGWFLQMNLRISLTKIYNQL